MEFGKLERSMYIEATPDVVYEVVSSPEHIQEWWPDEVVDLEPTPGSTGQIIFGDRNAVDHKAMAIAVVEAQPPKLFSFRWTQPLGDSPVVGNSLLVVFELEATGSGTTVRMTETGFREMGWEVAVLEQQYNEHVQGWDHFLPRLVDYAARVGVQQ